MSKVNFSKFSNGFVLNLKGIVKDAYIDDFKNGESYDGVHFNIDDIIDEDFVLNGEETKEELTNLIVEYLKKELHSKKIEKDWIMINNDEINLSISEDGDSYPIDDVEEAFKNGDTVYSCYYNMKMSINGKRLIDDDLMDMFDFEH